MPRLVTRPHYTVDTLLQMKDAGAITADGNAQVAAVDKIIDVGDAQMYADITIDISAIDVASADEKYEIYVEGSTDSGFASGIDALGMLEFGDSSVIQGDVDSIVGRYILCFTNTRNIIVYRYIRLRIEVTGTTPSINFVAYMNITR